MTRPTVILDGSDKEGRQIDVILTPYMASQSIKLLEPYVRFELPEGVNVFAMRIGELQDTLTLIENSGDERV